MFFGLVRGWIDFLIFEKLRVKEEDGVINMFYIKNFSYVNSK